ncbi:pentapeptide repeat-containing protein [Paenibacillus apiarius]|uniref:pentapeptide repeat-containing protein n=1 Tax=Paenibacillus apiarius TaxID=46240 RepID=UPI0019822660|nr:pentapeptide repeat-containing protein [Paenibacillus apiarius]
MKKAESIAHFREHVVRRERMNMLLILERDFQLHKAQRAEEFISSFTDMCRTITDAQDQGDKGAIGYLMYSMLRTEIAEGRYTYLVEAMDTNWLFDGAPCAGSYDATWAFRHLDILGKRLTASRQLYGGAVTLPVVERILLHEALFIHRYVIALARYALPRAVQLKEYRDIVKEPMFEIRVGEYMDISEAVFKQDEREQELQAVKAWLDEKNDGEYAYESFRNLKLTDGDYGQLDFRYSDFIDSELSHSLLRDCVLIGTRWIGSDLKGADFSRCKIHGAEFRDCDLKGAVFRDIEGSNGWEESRFLYMPGISALSFAGSNVEGADFTGARLYGADFSDANIIDAVFDGANMKNAVFSVKQRESVHLNEIQQTQVLWKV